jgi:CheY-like chemotaxis protein
VPRILLVDDDIAEISAVKRVLLRAGHQTVLATNANDALAAVGRAMPGAALVSSTCENGGGLQLARKLLEEDATAELPVLLLGESPDAPPQATQIPRPLDPAQLAEELKLALAEIGRAPRVAHLELTALSPGTAAPKSAGGGRDGAPSLDRGTAADALRRRAEELRRQKPPATTPSWELEAPESPASDSPGERIQDEIDEELSRLGADAGAAGERDEAEAAIDRLLVGDLSDGGAAAEAEEELRRSAEAEARRQAEEEARRRAEAEEAAARAAEETARRELAERAAARAEAARRRALALATERKRAAAPVSDPPRTAAPSPPPPPPAPAPVPEIEPELPAPPAELASGSLAEAPVPRLLGLAARSRLVGRLDFGGDAPRSVFFDDGRVVGVSSAAPHERIEEVALRLGLITREQHRQAAPAATGLASRRAAVLLLDRGFLKPTELTALVRRRTEEVVFALFAETSARFRYAAARVPADERTALERGPFSLALEGVRRKWLGPRLDAVLGGPGSLLSPAPEAPSAAEIGLSAAEQRLFDLADGLRTLDEILAGSPLDPLESRQILAGLLMVGALSLRFHAGPEFQVEAPTIDLGRVKEKLEQVRRSDYFTILGLSRHCSPYEVREAAGRLAAEFDPGRYAGYREPGLPDELDEILRVVAEAREVLLDDALRAEYLVGLGGELV